MDEYQETEKHRGLTELRLLREEVGNLRDELFVPLSEIVKQLVSLNDAVRSLIRQVKREDGDGK